MCNFCSIFVADFVCAYENIIGYRTCRRGIFAAECRCDIQEGSQFPFATYPSERAHEARRDPLLYRAGQGDAAGGKEEDEDLGGITNSKLRIRGH